MFAVLQKGDVVLVFAQSPDSAQQLTQATSLWVDSATDFSSVESQSPLLAKSDSTYSEHMQLKLRRNTADLHIRFASNAARLRTKTIAFTMVNVHRTAIMHHAVANWLQAAAEDMLDEESRHLRDCEHLKKHLLVLASSNEVVPFLQSLYARLDARTNVVVLAENAEAAEMLLPIIWNLVMQRKWSLWLITAVPWNANDVDRLCLARASKFVVLRSGVAMWQSARADKFMADMSVISTVLAVQQNLSHDPTSWSELIITELVHNENARLFPPQLHTIDDELLMDDQLSQIVAVTDPQVSPMWAAGNVFSSVNMIDNVMFASYYSCYTLALIHRMAMGQLELRSIRRGLVGSAFSMVVDYISSEEGGGGVAIGLFRPVGTLDSLLPYVYTMPRHDTVIVQGDQVYVLKREQNEDAEEDAEATELSAKLEVSPKSENKDFEEMFPLQSKYSVNPLPQAASPAASESATPVLSFEETVQDVETHEEDCMVPEEVDSVFSNSSRMTDAEQSKVAAELMSYGNEASDTQL